MKILIQFFKNEAVLFIFLFLLILLAVLYPKQILHYPSFVDWKTIVALGGLLIITTGLKESGYFGFFARNSLKKLKSERSLAVFLILLSVLLSAFITNDITLFIVIPLTIALQSVIKNDVSKLIIFEVIAVNTGSSLTPIGNPQNLFLWHNWNISFFAFIFKMFPFVIVLIVVLLLFAWITFPSKKIFFKEKAAKNKPKKKLFVLSVTMLAGYIVSLETNSSFPAFFLVFVVYLFLYRRVILKADWLLLLLFIIIFIDFHLISTLPVIVNLVNSINLDGAGNVFLFSVVSSQTISNVPASIFIAKFSNDWQSISYGVNVAGNGLIWSSLANLIALRIWKERKFLLDYHKFAIPYLMVTVGIVYVLFYIL